MSYHRLSDGLAQSRTTADDFGGNDSPKLKFLATVQFSFHTQEDPEDFGTKIYPYSVPLDANIDGNTSQTSGTGLNNRELVALGNNVPLQAVQAYGPWSYAKHDQQRKDASLIKGYNDRASAINETGGQSNSLNSMAYALKQATRPNISINYQDANFYNYRTKVATKADYGPMTLTFYDDNKNRAHNIFLHYMASVSPIFNVGINDRIFDRMYENMEATSVNSSQGGLPKDFLIQNPASSIGPLSDRAGIIASITVSHYYAFTDRVGNYFIDRTDYKYVNPKVQTFVLDELDMTQSEASTITMTCNYDVVNVSRHRVSAENALAQAQEITSISKDQNFKPRFVENEDFADLVGNETSNIGLGITNTADINSAMNRLQSNASSVIEQAKGILNTVSRVNSGVSLDSLSQFGNISGLVSSGNLSSLSNLKSLTTNLLGFGGGNVQNVLKSFAKDVAFQELNSMINDVASNLLTGNPITDILVADGASKVRNAASKVLTKI